MDKIKTTEELISFLDSEFKAINGGQKGLPFTPTEDQAEELERAAGMMGAFLGAERMAQVSYYHQVRDEVWQYQRDHNVSGLITEVVEIGGKTLRFPCLSDQLIATADDREVMAASKDRVVDFFVDFCRSNLVYLSHELYSKQGGQWPMETSLAFVSEFAGDMEWATIYVLDGFLGDGRSLKVGYGDMREADYIYDKDAESWTFDATTAVRWTNPETIQAAKVVSLGFDEIRQMRKNKELGS